MPVVHWRSEILVQVATNATAVVNCTSIRGSTILQTVVIPAISVATSTVNRAANADPFSAGFRVCGAIDIVVMDATDVVRLIVGVDAMQRTVVATHAMVAVLSVWGCLWKQRSTCLRFQKPMGR
mgnify:CR=1 FL=1